MIRQADDFPVLKKNHIARVRQKGRNVRSHKMLPDAHPEDQRRGHAGRIHHGRFLLRHHRHGVRPARLTQRPGEALKERRRAGAPLGNEMRQHFRIRFGSELITGSQQIRLQF